MIDWSLALSDDAFSWSISPSRILMVWLAISWVARSPRPTYPPRIRPSNREERDGYAQELSVPHMCEPTKQAYWPLTIFLYIYDEMPWWCFNSNMTTMNMQNRPQCVTSTFGGRSLSIPFFLFLFLFSAKWNPGRYRLDSMRIASH